jgi:hypothetical protein
MDGAKEIETTPGEQQTSNGQRGGGPVFLPRRHSSALAHALLSQPWHEERVTPYDEQWFLGRPVR